MNLRPLTPSEEEDVHYIYRNNFNRIWDNQATGTQRVMWDLARAMHINGHHPTEDQFREAVQTHISRNRILP